MHLKIPLAILLLAAPAALLAEEPRVLSPDDTKLLMLDTRVIEHSENARLVVGVPEKDERNPLLPSDQPWENATNNYYPNVLWDADAREWKLWYKDVLADKEAIAQMEQPGDEGRTDYRLFAMQRVCDFHRTRRVLSFPTMSGLPFPRLSISSAGERRTVGGVGTATRCRGAHWEHRSPNRQPQNRAAPFGLCQVV